MVASCLVEDSKNIETPRPKVVREREPSGRERWLDTDEISRLRSVAEPDWWLLFAVLLYTGVRIGEAQGLNTVPTSLTAPQLIGHSTPNMVIRYAKHGPEAYFDEDVAKIAQGLDGGGRGEKKEVLEPTLKLA